MKYGLIDSCSIRGDQHPLWSGVEGEEIDAERLNNDGPTYTLSDEPDGGCTV